MSLLRGWLGEKKTTFNMWLSLDRNVYRRFHDLIIPGNNGSTQIDHLLVSQHGIFIVETKNQKGWIFGSENQPRWTQSIYGKKYSFQNPLHQAFRQKKVLSEFLDIEVPLIQIVIFFVGNCEFKTNVPGNVLSSNLGRYIKKFSERVISLDDVDRITGKLDRYVSVSRLSTRDHVNSLRRRHASTSVCPKCGAGLVERTAMRGSHAGSRFLGCENFPKCRFTRNN